MLLLLWAAQLPSHLILRDHRRLVSATSSWYEAKDMQVWILQWLNEEQLSRQRSPSRKSKGGGDLIVKVTSDGSVKYSMAR